MLVATSFSIAQSNGPLYKPLKKSYYDASSTTGGWDFSRSVHFTYNTKGDVLTMLTKDASQVIIRKDSMIYSETSQVLEKYSFNWDVSLGKLIPESKILNFYHATGRYSGTLVYQWTNMWELSSGTEHLISYNDATKEETEITKIYTATTDKWDNMTKKVVLYDAQHIQKMITLYTADSQKNFQLFSRQTFSDWHDYAKGIYTAQISENYVNGSWTPTSSSTITKVGELWVELEDRKGNTAGIYKIFFSDDNSYKEVMKQHDPGWLAISLYSKTGNIEKTVQNDFIVDVIKTIQTNEKEVDTQGNLIRTTLRIQNETGSTTRFSEVLHDISYDERSLILEDVSLVSTSELSEHVPVQKIVYGDYVDVSLITSDEAYDQTYNSAVGVYPNPSTGIFHISGTSQVSSVSVYNASGVWLKTISPTAEQKIDISDLKPGIYHLRIISDKYILKQNVSLTPQ